MAAIRKRPVADAARCGRLSENIESEDESILMEDEVESENELLEYKTGSPPRSRRLEYLADIHRFA